MGILKNIFLNFNFILNKNLSLNLLFISFIIKLLFFYFFNKNKLYNNFFLENIIFKIINKNNKLIIFFFSFIMFFNIFLSNLIDLFPNILLKNFLNKKSFNIVPSSNINLTFNYSLLSIILIIYSSIKFIGIFNFFKNFFIFPIKNKFFFFFNFIIEFSSFIMKPISLSLRLFGNIFSSEIIFNLINKMNIFCNIFFFLIWSIFHYLILPLQSFIFITLFIIYTSQNLKH